MMRVRGFSSFPNQAHPIRPMSGAGFSAGGGFLKSVGVALVVVGAACSNQGSMHGDKLVLPSVVEPLIVSDGLRHRGEDPFHRLHRMAFLPDGRLVALSTGPSVRVYGAEGDLQEEMGRRGSGPGEFSGLLELHIAGDTVEIGDAGSRRITRWLPDQGEIWTEPWPHFAWIARDGFHWRASPPGVPAPDGSRLVAALAAARMGAAPDHEHFPAVLRIPAEGGEPGVLVSALTVRRSRATTLGGQSGTVFDGRSRVSHLVGVLGSGAGAYLVRLDEPPASPAETGSWTATILTPTGDTLEHRRFPWEFEERAGEWRVEHLRSLAPRVPESAYDQVERAVRSMGDVGMLVSPVEDVVATQDGLLWLRRDVGPESWEWIALTEELRPVARIQLPKPLGVAASLDGRLAVSPYRTWAYPEEVKLFEMPETP